MNKLDVNNTHNGCAFLGVVLAVLLLSVNGWGECTVSNTNNYYRVSGDCPIGEITGTNGQFVTRVTGCFSRICWKSYAGNSRFPCGGDCPDGWEFVGHDCSTETLRCGSTCEADSLACVSQGNSWLDDASASCGKSCKIINCKAADSTWLSTSIAACTGENNYAIVNTDSTCEHAGACCNGFDSIPEGNSCRWRCDSVLTTCNNRIGELFGGVLPDTSISGQDTTFSYQCYYNCSHSPNPDSSVYLVEGNIVLSGPSDSIPDGIKSETFNSVRTTTGGVYVYDYLSPSASEYIDSIAAMKCVEHLWRCVINNKYVYWYDNQEVPAGCTNIVRVK